MKKKISTTLNGKRLLPIVKSEWREIGDLSFLSLSSNGGEFNLKWINSLERESMSEEALSRLISQVFEERPKKTFELSFISGALFKCEECHLERAKKFAKSNDLPEADLAAFPLLCELLSFQADELIRPSTILLMHKELKDKLGRPMQLAIDLLDKSIRIGHYSDLTKEKKFFGDVYFVFGA